MAPTTAGACAAVRCHALLLLAHALPLRSNKFKNPSASEMYQLLGMDLFATPSKVEHISRFVRLPRPDPATLRKLPPGFPPVLVVNWLLPNYPPACAYRARWRAAGAPSLTLRAASPPPPLPPQRRCGARSKRMAPASVR